jgi:hypothetical protein
MLQSVSPIYIDQESEIISKLSLPKSMKHTVEMIVQKRVNEGVQQNAFKPC